MLYNFFKAALEGREREGERERERERDRVTIAARQYYQVDKAAGKHLNRN